MSAQQSLVYRWVPDDTEESIVGADWHQEAIANLWSGLRAVAGARGWSWHVGNQLTLVAWHPDGAVWRPKPDIMVHGQAGAAPRQEMSATADGLPELIIEVASPSTYSSDVSVSPPSRARPEAKGFEYLAWPLPEYLVFDPSEAHLPGQVRAWRTVEGRVVDWLPDAAGRYHSQSLGISFRPDGFFLRIFDPEGVPAPLAHEQAAMITRLQRERAQAEQERADALQERADALRRAMQAEEENAALRALVERLRGQDSG